MRRDSLEHITKCLARILWLLWSLATEESQSHEWNQKIRKKGKKSGKKKKARSCIPRGLAI